MTDQPKPHAFDDDGVCSRCGFDGAEFWHYERSKPKDCREPMPDCIDEVNAR